MNQLKRLLLGGVWTCLVLAPFAITVTLLKPEVKMVLLFFFVFLQLRYWKNWIFLRILQNMMFLTIIFTSLSGVFYKFFMFIKFDCGMFGCAGNSHVSAVAAMSSVGTTLLVGIVLWRRNEAFKKVFVNPERLVDTAGIATRLVLLFL